nr:hypothetical protein [Tanacetum cinerariifolium]
NLEEATTVRKAISLLRQTIGSSPRENTGAAKPESTSGSLCNKFRGDKGKVILVLVIRVMLLVLGETIQVDRHGLLNATTVKEKAMLAEAQEVGQILDEEQLAFVTDLGVPDDQAVQTIIPNNATFQTEDLDTYDSNYDGISNAKAVLMANISNYSFDVISEVPHSETYLKDMENQESPKELTKVSLVNESLKKLKLHLVNFDKMVKIRTTLNARTEGEWGFEHTKAVFNNEIIPFIKYLKDIFNVFNRDLLNEIMEVQTVFDQMDADVQQSLVNKQCLENAKKDLFLEND